MDKHKVKVPNVVRGGIAIPLGNNYYFMRGRKHINGGIDIGNNSRTGIEVEDGEVMKMEHGGAKIFSSVPFLNGKSPALRLLQGENPAEVFKEQENFKIRNNINNDGTPKNKKNTAICEFGGDVDKRQKTLDEVNKNAKDSKKTFTDKGKTYKVEFTPKPESAPNVKNGEPGLKSVYPEFDVLTAGRKLFQTPNILRSIDTIIRKPNKVGKYDLGKGIDSQEGAKQHLKKSIINFGIDLINPLFKVGGQAKWRSSNKIRSRIAKMEGSSMKTNRSFDLEDRDFYNAMPREVRESLSQDALDNLYSYSYNVGAGNFKKRVVPRLLDLKRGKVGADAVAKAMWASKDNELRGLRLRRNIERAGFINAYNNAKKKNNINTNINAAPVDNTYVSKPVIIQQKDNGLNALQQATDKMKQIRDNYANQYNQYVTGKGMELMQPKKRYNSTFALGGRINHSTGDDSRKKYGWGDKILDRTVRLGRNVLGFDPDDITIEVKGQNGKTRKLTLKQYRAERASRKTNPFDRRRFNENNISYNPFTGKYSYDENKENYITGVAPTAGVGRGSLSAVNKTKKVVNGARKSINAARATYTAKKTKEAKNTVNTVNTARGSNFSHYTQTVEDFLKRTPVKRISKVVTSKPVKPKQQSAGNFKIVSRGDVKTPMSGKEARALNAISKGQKTVTDRFNVMNNPVVHINENATIDGAIKSGWSYARHAQQAQKLRNEKEAGEAAMQAINKFGKAANIVNHPYLYTWQNAADKIVKGAAIGGLGTYGLLTATDLYNRQYGNNKNTKRNVKTEATNRPITYRYNNVKLYKFKAIDGQVFNSKEEAIQHNKNIQTQVSTRQTQAPTRQDRRNVRTNIPSKKDYSNIKFTMQHDTNDDAQDRNVLDNIVALNKQKDNFRKTLKTNLATVPSLNSGLSTKINNKYVETKKNEAIKNNNQNNRPRFTTNDYIGLGANAIGSLASTIINARMLNRMKYPNAPTQMTAAKLKTNYNINPQLDAIREQSYNFDSSVDSNTGSSQVALARKQRNRLNRLAAKNELYAQKENYQNEMINKDRLNQQGIANQNIEAYNAWRQGKTAFENNVAEKRSENYIAGLQNLNSGVQDMLSRQEQREHDNNTIKAMLAANPNVKPKLFSYYGLDLYRFGGCKRNK